MRCKYLGDGDANGPLGKNWLRRYQRVFIHAPRVDAVYHASFQKIKD